MKIFLTGANGYIGRNFLKRAAIKGHKIYAVTRKKNNKKIKNVSWLVGPIDKKWKELEKANVLLHLATVGGYEKFPKFKQCYEFNVIKSTNLILNALEANCKNWIIISTEKENKIKSLDLSPYNIDKNKSEHSYNYAITKALFSKICIYLSKHTNIKCKIIKLFHVWGGDEKKSRLWPSLIKAAKKNQNFKMTTGSQKNDFSNIQDVVDGILKELYFHNKENNYPRVLEMGSGKVFSVRKFATLVWKKYKPKSKIEFGKIKVFDKKNYKINKKNFLKINFTNPGT